MLAVELMSEGQTLAIYLFAVGAFKSKSALRIELAVGQEFRDPLRLSWFAENIIFSSVKVQF